MNLESIEPNYLWALVGGIAYYAVGAAWYTFLFRDRWLLAQGKTLADIEANPGAMPGMSGLALNFVGSLVIVTVVAALYEWAGGNGLADGIMASLIVSVGVIAMESLKGIAYYAHSWMLYGINVGYAVVGLGIAGAIYGALA